MNILFVRKVLLVNVFIGLKANSAKNQLRLYVHFLMNKQQICHEIPFEQEIEWNKLLSPD